MTMLTMGWGGWWGLCLNTTKIGQQCLPYWFFFLSSLVVVYFRRPHTRPYRGWRGQLFPTRRYSKTDTCWNNFLLGELCCSSETTARHNSLADSRFDGLTSYIHACILFGRAFPSSFDVDGDLFFFFFAPLVCFYYYYHFQGLLLFAESRVVPILFDCLTVKVVHRVKVLGLIGEEQSRAHFPSTASPPPTPAMSAQRIDSRNESRHRESFVRRGETSSSSRS
jgi:hypothetical protein